MMKTFISILGMALLIVMGFGGSAMAIGNIKIGQIAVHPSITEKGMWDSNIDLNAGSGTKSDGTTFNEPERSDYINTITPALIFQLKKSLLDVSFGAKVDIVRYKEYDKNDAENFAANFNAQYGGIGRTGLYLKVNNQFMDTQDPYSQSGIGDYRYKEGKATKRKANIAGIEAGYGLADRLALHVNYTNQYQKYDEAVDKDSNERDHIVGTTLYYKIFPKTYALLGYKFTTIEYFDYTNTNNYADCGKDSKNHNLDFGIFWDQTAKFNGSVKVGYYWKNWDNAVNNANNTLEDLDTWTITTHMGWKPLTRTMIMIDLTKGEVDSVDATYYSYDQFVAGLTLNQQVANKLSITVGGCYETDDYNSNTNAAEKKFDLYQTNAGINYQIMKWLSAGISYTYKKKDASKNNFVDDEYKDHQTMFKITGSF
jgi:hypothetical protein